MTRLQQLGRRRHRARRRGAALVANDMHLGLRLPHIWFRAQIDTPDGRGGTRSVGGLTLPGTPTVIAGSNGHVAWGLTNSYGDFADPVRLVPGRARLGADGDGPGPARRSSRDTIRVAHGEPIAVETTREPVRARPLHRTRQGHEYALQWTAYRPEAVNLDLLRMETATTAGAALDVVNARRHPGPERRRRRRATGTSGGPSAGASRTASAATGRRRSSRPTRTRSGAASATRPTRRASWTPRAGRCGRPTTASPAARPSRSSASGRTTTAPARGVIRDDLRALTGRVTEADLLAVQLDDRGAFYDRWQRLLLATLDADALRGRPDRARLRARVEPLGRARERRLGRLRARRAPSTTRSRTSLTAALLAPGAPPLPRRRRPARVGAVAHRHRAARGPAARRRGRRGARVLLAAADSAMAEPPTWGEHNTRRHRAPARRRDPRPGRRPADAARPARRRRPDAARGPARLRRVRAHGRRAGARGDGHPPHARRAGRPPALAVLGRGPRRLGRRAARCRSCPAGRAGRSASSRPDAAAGPCRDRGALRVRSPSPQPSPPCPAPTPPPAASTRTRSRPRRSSTGRRACGRSRAAPRAGCARPNSRLGSLRTDLPVLVRLVRAYARGDYRRLPWKSIVLATTALLYFVTPVRHHPGLHRRARASSTTPSWWRTCSRPIRDDLGRFEEWEAVNALADPDALNPPY